ncbi:MAG TPA: DUF4355 domain-containing protein [Candidatus Limiplasma sp.]|nr:DUF4355 domain-containing protein [Candidatus Limiplasma sp.]
MSTDLEKIKEQETVNDAQTDTAEKAFTQDDINRIVSQTIASERKKAEAAVAQARQEAEALAQMTAEQRAQHQMAERETALAAREDALKQREIHAETVQLLQQKGLPADLADALSYADRDSMQSAVDQLEQAFRTALQQGIEERMKGMTPAAATGTTAGFEAKLKRAVGIQ